MKKNLRTFLKACYLLIAGGSVVAQTSVSAVRVGETNPTLSAYVFGTGEQVSGQQFQTDGILTYKGYQYTVYYNLSRNVCIARRKMPMGEWQELALPYRNSRDDAHNVITMGICHNDGTIHLAYDHHNDPLHYCYSIAGSANDPDNMPWEAASFSPTTNVMDRAVPDVTYPRFISKPDGNLLFECRFHYSGYGDSYLREYDAATKQWTLIGRYVQGMDVTPDACAYINGMTYDNLNRLHVTWCWRDDFGGQSNHDFYYAYSEDDGRTWKDNNGDHVATTQYMLPAVDRNTGSGLTQKLKNQLMIEAIPYNKGYINQETQAVDSRGRIHAVNSHIPMNQGTDSNWGSSRTKARLHHRFRDTDGTWKTIQIKNNGNTVNSYCRVSLSFDAYDNAYVVANGAEVYTATAAMNYEDWNLLSGVDRGRFVSEPLVDRTLLLNEGVLSFVYLGLDKKVTVIDYLTKNPHTPDGSGLKAEYYSDENFGTLIRTGSSSDGSNIPAGTKSIRWSGTFETVEGEAYTLYVSTADDAQVYVNGRLTSIIKGTGTVQEYSFNYNLIPSHKNNIVIESKTASPLQLSWSSAGTAKAAIASTFLYPEKAHDESTILPEPELEGKAELGEKLLTESKAIQTATEKNTFTVAPFNPAGDYSLEVKTKINLTEGRGIDVDARAANGRGFRFSFSQTSVSNTADVSNPVELSLVDNMEEQTYRFAVQGDKAYIFCGQQYLGNADLMFTGDIQNDDTESAPTATYGNELIPNWAGPSASGTGSPTEYGWESAGQAVGWNVANGNGGVRYLDINRSTNPNHLLNGSVYEGRLMTIRWDGNLSSNIYYYPVELEANTSYEFSMVYEHWNNGAIGAPITVGIAQTKQSAGIYDSQTYATIAKNTLQEAKFQFLSREAGTYYLAFTGAGGTMYGIGDLSVKSVSYDSRLIIGKNYNGGNVDAEILSVTYEDEAYAPDVETSIGGVPAIESDISVYTDGNELTVSSGFTIESVAVYNASGNCISVKTCNSDRCKLILPAGFYLLKIKTENNSAVKKVIVK